jgi:hypothetical protein
MVLAPRVEVNEEEAEDPWMGGDARCSSRRAAYAMGWPKLSGAPLEPERTLPAGEGRDEKPVHIITPDRRCSLKRIHFIGVAIAAALATAIAWKELRPHPAAAQSLDVRASCDKRAMLSQCSEYSEPAFAAGERSLKGPCGVMKGTFSANACPTDDTVGTCFFGGTERRHYYADGLNPYSATSASRDCATSEGKFSLTNASSTK